MRSPGPGEFGSVVFVTIDAGVNTHPRTDPVQRATSPEEALVVLPERVRSDAIGNRPDAGPRTGFGRRQAMVRNMPSKTYTIRSVSLDGTPLPDVSGKLSIQAAMVGSGAHKAGSRSWSATIQTSSHDAIEQRDQYRAVFELEDGTEAAGEVSARFFEIGQHTRVMLQGSGKLEGVEFPSV